MAEVGRDRDKVVKFFRGLIVNIDMAFHVVVAFLLLASCAVILFYAIQGILTPSRQGVLHLVNDVLLVLIILELLWTVLRFLKKQKFLLGPFFAIGIIASIRRILLIEAQTSLVDHMPREKMIEMGLSAVVILALVIAYYISVKAQKLEG